jgi:hypothetical protein
MGSSIADAINKVLTGFNDFWPVASMTDWSFEDGPETYFKNAAVGVAVWEY